MSKIDLDIVTRLLNLAVTNGECQELNMCLSRGRPHVGDEYTSRYVYRILVGEIGELHVLHKCDNKLCINPNHLFLGTNQDNVNDKIAKGRQGKCGGSVKRLSPEQVVRLKNLRANGLTYKALGERFGINPQTAWNYINE